MLTYEQIKSMGGHQVDPTSEGIEDGSYKDGTPFMIAVVMRYDRLCFFKVPIGPEAFLKMHKR